jgi:protein ImuB
MFACLHLPDFPLQARLCQMPGLRWEPVAILDGGDSRQQPRIIALTRAAAEARVEPGMSAAQARARCAHIQLLPRDPDAEKAAQHRLLELAARHSADFEATAPGLITIDLGMSPLASARYGDLERLGHEWVAELADAELKAQAGFAPNPDLAALAARMAAPVHSFRGDPDAIRAQLAHLPLEILDPPADYRAILILWGIATLGDLAALPRDDLAERLGPGATDLWDRAAGRARRLLRLVRAPADFSHRVDLDDHEIAALEPLMFLIRRGLETLAARLASVYLAAATIRLTLRFSDGGAAEHYVRVPDPSRDVDRLFALIQTRLENVVVSAPIEGFQLAVDPARPGQRPGHLFESALRDPNRFAETLAQIEALVGADNAGSPEPRDTHRPDAFAMRPFDPATADQTGSALRSNRVSSPMQQGLISDPTLFGRKQDRDSPLPGVQGLPLRRFRPPLPVQLNTRLDAATGIACPAEIMSGQIHGRLHRVSGPWRLSGDWWERGRGWRREEWDAQLEDGSLYRIACWRDASAANGPENPPVTWYLEGVYG